MVSERIPWNAEPFLATEEEKNIQSHRNNKKKFLFWLIGNNTTATGTHTLFCKATMAIDYLNVTSRICTTTTKLTAHKRLIKSMMENHAPKINIIE